MVAQYRRGDGQCAQECGYRSVIANSC